MVAAHQGSDIMKTMLVAIVLCLLQGFAASAGAATPAQEKQFMDTYRRAYEASDSKTLQGLLYTKGADPQALDFYKTMLMSGAGSKIGSLELKDLTAEDKARLANSPAPDGRAMKFSAEPTKKLVIKSTQRGKNGESNSTTSIFIADVDGQLRIPVPGPK